MGVLTLRLHGPITAIAAIAAVSTWTELFDKPSLRPIFDFTGQTIMLSSLYAPSASSSFESNLSLQNSPRMSSMAMLQPTGVPPIVRSSSPTRPGSNIMAFSPFTSQSAAVRFYRAGPPTISWVVSSTPSPQGVFYASSLSPPKTKSSPLRVLDAWWWMHSNYPQPLAVLRYMRSTAWKYPATARSWHAHINANHPLAAEVPFPFLRFPQAYHLEKIFSFLHSGNTYPPIASTSLLHMWHDPLNTPKSDDGEKQPVKHKPSVAVVLLGWLGAEHRHLKKYADWYTSRGIHAVTFVVPMKDLFTLKVGDRAEKHVDVLTQNLVQWLKEDASQGNEKIVIFHTFSNTGWLIYGAVLERLINEGDEYLEKIKGCVVDSAPSARPDPQVWASGFSAALLKKSSVATQMLQATSADGWNATIAYPKPSLKEIALLAMLEKFFSVFLQIPYVNRRLNDVISVLATRQPSCPQLYIYSSADTIIPAKSVESFIEDQKRVGHIVRACNFQSSPHVDHFRTYPEKYSEQLTSFLKVCVPQWASQ